MSESFNLSIVDYVIFGIMLAVSAAIGLYFRIRGGDQKTNDDFLLAGRNMPIFPVAFSLMATFMSATTLMGIPAEMYLFGTHMVFMNVGFILGPIISSYVFLPVYFENEVSTPYEYLEKRFGTSTRRILSAIFLFQNTLFNGVVLYAPSLALSAVTNLSIWTSVISIGVVCTFYCTIGGMKAVLWTDVFQAFLMYICLIVIIVKGCMDLGGFSNIFNVAYDGGRIVLPTFELDFSTRYTMYSVLLMGLILTTQCYGCSQIQIQRQLSMKTLKSSIIASLISAPMVAAFQILCCLSGLIFYVYFKKCDPMSSTEHPIHSADQLMPYYVVSTMNQYPGLPGLCIAGIFSASLSSISSAVNSMAAVTYEDIIKSFMPNPTKSVLITKIATVFYGALSIFITYIVASMGNLVKAAVLTVGMIAGPALGLFLLAVFSTRVNEMGANLGMLAGFLIGGCLTFVPNPRHYPTLPVGQDCQGLSANTSNATLASEEMLTNEANFQNQTYQNTLPVSVEDNFPVSYMWIAPICMMATILVGYISSLVISLFTEKRNSVPATLLCPLRRKFLPKEKLDEKTSLSTATMVSKL